MPCKGFHVDQLAMPLVLDVHRFYQWFTRYLVDTAQRLIHIVYPEMNSWGFSTQYDPQNPHLHCIAWASPRIGPLDTVDQCTLAIFIQPPWILAKQDIDSFTKCSYLPPFNNQLTGHIDSKYKLWAKVYDTCVAKGCRYFILSNYNSFALGVFTEGYTTAFVVKGPDCTSTKPNILECLFYWIASSMRVPSSFCVPEVGDEHSRPFDECPCLVSDMPDMKAAFALCGLS
ncbi:hypothetical protein OF83DRAFT_1110700 [Amylostereum chailletii]|nr:hypothetical protein OF83DRAFT_1110700 [Amylostereum chailletii]